MKVRHILMSTLALSLLALGVSTGTAHANSFTSYNKPKNALTSYIKLGHFNMINNANYSVRGAYNFNRNINPNRQLTTVGGNWKDSYKPYATLQDIPGEYNPQSVVIKPDGTTFISYGLGNSKTQLVRYNINDTDDNNGTTELSNPHFGPVFRGGHGQSMAWNSKTNQLWLQFNNGSATDNVSMLLINQKTLKPMHQLKFNFGPYPFGDALAFDNKGNAYTGTDTYSNSTHRGAPVGSFKLYKGKLSYNHANFHMIQGLKHTPGDIIQNMIFNPANNRMYILADGNYVSFPANQKVTPSNVHSTKLSEHYEPEDMAFYKGHTYLLLHYPSQLMINTNDDRSRGSHKAANMRRNHARKVHNKRNVKRSKRVTKRSNKRKIAKRAKKNNRKARKAAKKVTKHATKRSKRHARNGYKKVRRNRK